MGVRRGIIEGSILALAVAFAYLDMAPHFEQILTNLNWPVNVDTEGVFLAVYFFVVLIFARWVSYKYK